jgi:hypothetical protein
VQIGTIGTQETKIKLIQHFLTSNRETDFAFLSSPQ